MNKLKNDNTIKITKFAREWAYSVAGKIINDDEILLLIKEYDDWNCKNSFNLNE